MSQFVVTRKALAEAFAEWERRYREDPTAFEADWHDASMPTATYGEAAADYFLKVLQEVGFPGQLNVPLSENAVPDPE